MFMDLKGLSDSEEKCKNNRYKKAIEFLKGWESVESYELPKLIETTLKIAEGE